MEQVFVVDRVRFFGGDWPQGFTQFAGAEATALLAAFRGAGRYEPRPLAETTPAWRQLIPYCVLRRPGEVFCVERKRAATERRLHGLLSIGLGGHVNPAPEEPDRHASESPEDQAKGFFLRALREELREELEGLPWAERGAGPAPDFRGLLVDDGNEVGRVHAGLVFTLDLPLPSPSGPAASAGADLRIREISKLAGGFRSLVELQALWQDPGRFESWSHHLLQVGIAGRMAVSRTGGSLPDSSAANWQHEERPHG